MSNTKINLWTLVGCFFIGLHFTSDPMRTSDWILGSLWAILTLLNGIWLLGRNRD